MLNPNEDRQDYGSILSAPPNYELDFAIGTSYSLDLDSLIGASISLGLNEETDTVLKDNPIFLLEALRATGDKVALFCQKGSIHLPNNPTKLHILLEEMVFQVNVQENEKTGKYPSFHPKFWLIRYVNENDEVQYRVIALSRNLTFDRSWDICFAMDGWKREKILKKNINKNKPLSVFLNYLKEFTTDSTKKDKIEQIIGELDYMEFELKSGPFNDFDFIPNGVGDDVSIMNYPLFKKSLDSIAVMSPFLSNSVIKDFNERLTGNGNSENAYLFTRAESLSRLDLDDCSQFKIYILKDQIVNGESLISGDGITESETLIKNENIEESSEKADIDTSRNTDNIDTTQNQEKANMQQDIHAKMYFIKYGKNVDLYLGSLNASHNAINGNIEFMIRLRTSSRKFGMKKFMDDLFCGEEGGAGSPFQLVDIGKYDRETPEESNELENIIRKIVRLDFKSKISQEEEYYKIILSVSDLNKFSNDYNISFKPLLSEKSEELREMMIFEKLNKIQLSEFFVLTVEKDMESISRVVKIETEGIPNDREKDLISSIVNDKEAFIRYVAFLLGDNDILSALETGMLSNTGRLNTLPREIQLPALYEKMLYSACYDKEKFEEIEYLIETLSDGDVIPNGFEELYNTFTEAIQ